jgi:hypothetical protein
MLHGVHGADFTINIADFRKEYCICGYKTARVRRLHVTIGIGNRRPTPPGKLDNRLVG